MASTNKKFVQNIAFLLLLNGLIKPFWIFGIDRTVQNTVAEGEYGVYFGLFNLAFLLHILLDFGINNYNNRTIAQNPSLIDHYLPSLLMLKLGLTFLYVAICFLVAYFLNYDAFQLKLLGFLMLNQIFLSFILYFRSNLSALHLFRQDSIISILDRSLMIVFCSGLLWWISAPFQIIWFVYVQTIGYFLTAIFAGFLVFRQIKNFSINWKKDWLLQLLKESYPFALIGLLMSIYNRLDGLMIKELLGSDGPAETTIYAAGYRILEAFNMVGYLFAIILLPMFSRLIKGKR